MNNRVKELRVPLEKLPVVGTMMVVFVVLSFMYAEDTFGQGKYRPPPPKPPLKSTFNKAANGAKPIRANNGAKSSGGKGKYKLGQSGVLKGPFNKAARSTNPARVNNGGKSGGGKGGHKGPIKPVFNPAANPSPKRITPIFNPAANPPGKGKPDKATPIHRPPGPKFKPGGI